MPDGPPADPFFDNWSVFPLRDSSKSNSGGASSIKSEGTCSLCRRSACLAQELRCGVPTLHPFEGLAAKRQLANLHQCQCLPALWFLDAPSPPTLRTLPLFKKSSPRVNFLSINISLPARPPFEGFWKRTFWERPSTTSVLLSALRHPATTLPKGQCATRFGTATLFISIARRRKEIFKIQTWATKMGNNTFSFLIFGWSHVAHDSQIHVQNTSTS